jgi:hypothetical protein
MRTVTMTCLFCSSLILAAGCGGNDDAGLGSGVGGAGAAGAAGGGGFGAFGTGGASGSASGGAGGTNNPDDRIDPIEVGRQWTYDVTVFGVYPWCKEGSYTGQVLGQKEVDGKQAFQVQSFCPTVGTSSYAVDGDRVEIYVGGVWVLALDAPVSQGHTWSNGASTFTWHEEGSVTVPAGTFDDCWRATENVAHDSYTIFCRGVGPVHWHNVDTGNGFDAVLTAKNF